jgi:hypothetical protein
LTNLKRYLAPVVIFILLVSLSGCTSLKEKETGKAPAENQQSLNVTVYYIKINNQEEYLVREVHRLPYTPDSVKAAAQEVIQGQPLTKGAEKVFPPETEILGVTIENGIATVNFSRAVLRANVGSEGEALGIQSMVNTLTEFPEIRAVSFQVEGKVDNRTKDWWGHIGLYNQPFRRNLSKVYEPAIWVTYPVENQVISIPLLVKGSARVFEGTVNVRFVDKNGKTLVENYTTATKGAPERGDFELSLKFEPPPTGQGYLEVFAISAKDGSEQYKVTVPVRWR